MKSNARELPMDIPIEPGVVIPPGQARYPFGEMDVGDSFFVYAPRDKRPMSAAYAWAKRHEKRTGEVRKFCSRTQGQHTRVWRIQ